MAKKILIIPSWYPNKKNDLVGTFFREQALLLSKNGFDIKILFAKEEEVGLIKYISIRLKALLEKRKEISTNYLLQEPKAYSFTIYHYRKQGPKYKIRNSKKQYENAFNNLTKDWKPELIHAQCTANAGIYASQLSNIFSIPYVIIEHQTFLLNHFNKFIQKEMVKAIANASKVGAVSYHQQRSILMNSIDCNPEIIWNLIDESLFKISKREPYSKFTITTITYPYPIKDAETFFKSLKTFNSISDGNFEAIIIGNDSFKDIEKAESSVFKALAEKYNVLDKCVFYPKLNREEINKQLQQCDVFVSTSIAETYGIAVREAMLCGKPVIATKSGGVEDSITKETGVLVNLKDYKAIAENLLKIKNKEITFNAEVIRNHIISQSGTESFIKTMTNFYSL